jgi:hypothetical protein
MEMPKPNEAHKRLAPLVGSWSGLETLHPAPWDPVGGSARGRVVNREILEGFAVVQEYEQRRGGTRNFSGHGVFWYDPAALEYVMTWWDTMGGAGSHFRGGFEGDRLVLNSTMPQGGLCRAIFDLSAPDRYSFLMEISPDGDAWHPAMEGAYRKASAARKAKGRRAARAKTAARMAASKKAAARTAGKGRLTTRARAARTRGRRR